mmetsp:Transcript_2936/g.5417  ORF Transcript_2936/g.5417 Transcript_2936/m.5417 type:complete len:142 (-) Transcript_2936:573-998(-)
MRLPSRMGVIFNSTQAMWPPVTPSRTSTCFKRTGPPANSGSVVVGSVPPQPLRQHQPVNNIGPPKQNANQHNLPMSSLQSARMAESIHHTTTKRIKSVSYQTTRAKIHVDQTRHSVVRVACVRLSFRGRRLTTEIKCDGGS